MLFSALMAACTVSFVDLDGIRHSVEVEGDGLYEASVLALCAFRKHEFEPGGLTQLEVEVLQPSTFSSANELAEFAEVIIHGAHELFPAVERGETIGSLQGPWWRLFREHPGERAFDWGAPDTGLRITWNLSDTLASSAKVSPGLLHTVSHLFSSCVDKFQDYLDARRILILQPHGEIRYNPDSWWAEVFAEVPPPPAVSEIWSGTYDWLDDTQRGWMFDKLHPVFPQPALKLVHKRVNR